MEKVNALKGTQERCHAAVTKETAILQAIVQWDTAKTIAEATVTLRDSVNKARDAVTESIDEAVAAQDRIVDAQQSIAHETSKASELLRSSIDAFKVAMEQSGRDADKWSRRMIWMTRALLFAAFVQAFAAVAQTFHCRDAARASNQQPIHLSTRNRNVSSTTALQNLRT